MGKASFDYNSRTNAWEFKGAGGALIARIGGGGIETGDGGTGIKKMGLITGTIGALTAVGTGLVSIGTVTNMTGLAIGDKVFVTPKAAIAGNIGLVGAYIPTTNTLNVLLANTKQNSAGSFVAKGVDVIYFRT